MSYLSDDIYQQRLAEIESREQLQRELQKEEKLNKVLSMNPKLKVIDLFMSVVDANLPVVEEE